MKTTTWTIGVAFFASISRVGAQSVVLGGACDPAQDVFGCQGKNYMACDPTSKRWILQNLCPTDCLGIPSFAQNCGRNSHGIEEPGTNPNPSPTTTTPTPTPTTTTTRPSTRPASIVPSIPVSTVPVSVSVSPNVTPVVGIVPTPANTPNPLPPASSASPASSSTKAPIWILGPALFVTLAVGTLLVVVYRRRRARFPDPETQIKPPFTPTLASVLEKRYVVVHPYVPAVNDEIALSTGDVVRLFLLFDDGWAKGVNEATGQTGLLPCACIEELSPPSHSPLAASPTTYSTASVSSITPVLPSSSSSSPR
ncbi:uncharacterized protein SPPG_06859 [Spizellomyces punctatus DAOM BR117]|uniref:SH3 domain-containing protein n=1 Tax=Spizellomyces punctatus (strain DAOM BR117) TaxID=645134 RepID=A0A0L0H8K3_SPIPD|nr:uncharacterized protein SPPG_06859 [Spizellomyces punctatus DAOM BR117]KNC97865.1 hypothetical protein SPPG_06859 [Spizellomyces punctatus DAOM BR117]|eukprot:XP_016605905.1 hypothetical protein SPPG_06859 [Spizellomyces punctatus DAOM BR117]